MNQIFFIYFFIIVIFLFYIIKNIYIIYLKKKFYNRSITNMKFKKYKIPKVCYQTWKTYKVPICIQKILENNKKKNPEIKFILMNDEDINNFIKKEFNENVYKAYCKINPKYGACRSDFFRYCILYKKGGIYLDIKSSLNKNIFKEIIKPDDICILDNPTNQFAIHRLVLNSKTYEQWILIFCKEHPYLKRMIDQMTEFILKDMIPIYINYNNQSKERVLRLTGPDAFTCAVNSVIVNYGILHRQVPYLSFASLIKYNNFIDFINRNRCYYEKKHMHYSKLKERLLLPDK